MTPLDRLAAVLARMTEGPWQAVKDEDDYREEADHWGVATECRFPLADMRESHDPAVKKVHPKNNAAGIAALRNVADALIQSVRASDAYHRSSADLDAYHAQKKARVALDSAIVKALGEGT